jgi:hypothetical protein
VESAGTLAIAGAAARGIYDGWAWARVYQLGLDWSTIIDDDIIVFLKYLHYLNDNPNNVDHDDFVDDLYGRTDSACCGDRDGEPRSEHPQQHAVPVEPRGPVRDSD